MLLDCMHNASTCSSLQPGLGTGNTTDTVLAANGSLHLTVSASADIVAYTHGTDTLAEENKQKTLQYKNSVQWNAGGSPWEFRHST